MFLFGFLAKKLIRELIYTFRYRHFRLRDNDEVGKL
jgi:hypothetical protein